MPDMSRLKTNSAVRTINTGNRQTMGTSFIAGFTGIRTPLKGKVEQTRPGKGDVLGGGTAVARKQIHERLGPSFRIVPSLKAPDPSGLSAPTTANGRIIPSALGNRDQFYRPTPEGMPKPVSTRQWGGPRRGRSGGGPSVSMS